MIKIGIAGAGAIAGVHIDSYKRFPQLCQVVAVCDSFKDKAEAVAVGKGLKARVYGDLGELMADPNVDAVSICLPPNAHCSAAEAGLRAGKHVLVEKPMAGSLEECDRMILAAETSGTILGIVSQNRYKTPVAKLKRMLDKGLLGSVSYANFDSLWWRSPVYYDLWWRGTWAQESGGCFMSHAVHYLDLMHYLFGMPSGVRASIHNVGHDNSECEDLGFAVFDYKDKIVHFTCSLVSHGERQSITVEGDRGSVGVPWTVSANKSLPNGFPEDDGTGRKALEDAYLALPDLEFEGHDAQLGNFLRAIRGEEPIALDGRAGKKTIELIMGIYKSSVSGAPVAFPLGAEDSFYRKESMVRLMPKFHEKKKSVDNFSASKITLGRDLGR